MQFHVRLTRKPRVSAVLALLATTASLGLTACNEDGQPSLDNDWVQATPTETPTSQPTTAPSPEPSASPTTSPTPSPTTTATDLYTGPAEVAKYVQKFVADALIQGVDVLPDMKSPKLEIRIASLSSYGSSVIGLCETGGSMRRVTFNPTFWNSVSETQRELLAHHELGHCVLYRGHRSTLLSTGSYASIMYPVIMSSSTYTNNYDYYQEELFTYSALESPTTDPNQSTVHICDQEDLGGAAH